MAEDVGLGMHSRVRGDFHPWRGHRWKLHMHMDGCHFFMSSYVCEECGASLATRDERDLNFDPWSMVWMTDEGGEEKCPRCQELLDGAEPESSMVLRVPA